MIRENLRDTHAHTHIHACIICDADICSVSGGYTHSLWHTGNHYHFSALKWAASYFVCKHAWEGICLTVRLKGSIHDSSHHQLLQPTLWPEMKTRWENSRGEKNSSNPVFLLKVTQTVLCSHRRKEKWMSPCFSCCFFPTQEAALTASHISSSKL